MKKDILLATDFSDGLQASMNFINTISTPEDNLMVLHVISNQGFSNPPAAEEDSNRVYEEKLEKLNEIASHFNCKTSVHLYTGNFLYILSDIVEKDKPTMLVISHHRYNFFDRILNGNIRNQIFEIIDCPIVCC